jgi:hypothetical protein
MMIPIWDVAPCNLVEVHRLSKVRTASTIRVIIILMIEAVDTSETSIGIPE